MNAGLQTDLRITKAGQAFLFEVSLSTLIFVGRYRIQKFFDHLRNADAKLWGFISILAGVIFLASILSLRDLSRLIKDGNRSSSLMLLTFAHFLIALVFGAFTFLNIIIAIFK